MKPYSHVLLGSALALLLTACGSDSNNSSNSSSSVGQSSSATSVSSSVTNVSSSASSSSEPAITPDTISLSYVSRFSTDVYGASAAEIPVFHPGSQRAFVVNSQAGVADILDLRNVEAPVKTGEFDAADIEGISEGALVNSVAIHGDLIALAIEAAVKTNPGYVAIYNAQDLELLGHVQVGALPDMLIFTPDGQFILVANEGEPNEDYSVDPEGSISLIDISDLANITVRTADFEAFNDKKDELIAKGVRIFGPGATVAQDLEPEYVAVSSDSKTAWAVLQENNAVAVIDIETATVTDVIPLGFKDHGVEGKGLDASDGDRDPAEVEIEIRTWPGLKGIYHPDGMVAYEVAGKTYLVTANEGDARAWGEVAAEDAVDNDEVGYFGLEVVDGRCNNDSSTGYIEEWRVKHLVHRNGFDRRCGNDLPGHLRNLAAGGHLNPDVFAYCGAQKGNPGNCRDDFVGMGRLLVTWTMGYQKNEDGSPKYYTAAGDAVEGVGNPLTDYLMYDELYAFGARSFAIWDPSETEEDGSMKLVYESGDFLEQHTASAECMLGAERNIPCADYFNSNHSHGSSMDRRSTNKGPEPEGLIIGQLGNKHFLFLGLERMGGVMAFDVTDPQEPAFVDYLNTRENWEDDPEGMFEAGRGVEVGDLGAEGVIFVAPEDSPNGEALIIVGNEVSGTTSVYQINQVIAD